jgi:hypothetical protein
MRPREAELVKPIVLHTSGNLLVKKPQQRASEVADVKASIRLNDESLLTLMKAGISSGDRIPTRWKPSRGSRPPSPRSLVVLASGSSFSRKDSSGAVRSARPSTLNSRPRLRRDLWLRRSRAV